MASAKATIKKEVERMPCVAGAEAAIKRRRTLHGDTNTNKQNPKKTRGWRTEDKADIEGKPGGQD